MWNGQPSKHWSSLEMLNLHDKRAEVIYIITRQAITYFTINNPNHSWGQSPLTPDKPNPDVGHKVQELWRDPIWSRQLSIRVPTCVLMLPLLYNIYIAVNHASWANLMPALGVWAQKRCCHNQRNLSSLKEQLSITITVLIFYLKV